MLKAAIEDSMAAGESVEPLQASKVHKKAGQNWRAAHCLEFPQLERIIVLVNDCATPWIFGINSEQDIGPNEF